MKLPWAYQPGVSKQRAEWGRAMQFNKKLQLHSMFYRRWSREKKATEKLE